MKVKTEPNKNSKQDRAPTCYSIHIRRINLKEGKKTATTKSTKSNYATVSIPSGFGASSEDDLERLRALLSAGAGGFGVGTVEDSSFPAVEALCAVEDFNSGSREAEGGGKSRNRSPSIAHLQAFSNYTAAADNPLPLLQITTIPFLGTNNGGFRKASFFFFFSLFATKIRSDPTRPESSSTHRQAKMVRSVEPGKGY